jgi:hypothetical protein
MPSVCVPHMLIHVRRLMRSFCCLFPLIFRLLCGPCHIRGKQTISSSHNFLFPVPLTPPSSPFLISTFHFPPPSPSCFPSPCLPTQSRHCAVGIVTGYRLDVRGSIPVTGTDFSMYSVQTGSEFHSASYSIGTGGSFTGTKAAGA